MHKYADVQIDDVKFRSSGMIVQWSSPTLGFGQIEIQYQGDKLIVDNEAMSSQFVKHLLNLMVDEAMPQHTSMEYLRRRGIEVFGDEEKFDKWMNSEIIALGGHKPVSLIHTDEGREQVITILGQIEHGVYS